MTRYVSILRGINVGGNRKIKMADLKELFSKLGFTNISTYIQSGNVAFEAEAKQSAELAQSIQQAIAAHYGYVVPTIVRTASEMRKSVESNPYLSEPDMDISRLHLVFLADSPSADAVDALHAVQHPPDRYHIAGQDVYICCAAKYSDTKLTNKFFETKLKVAATTRNWKTAMKLHEMAVASHQTI